MRFASVVRLALALAGLVWTAPLLAQRDRVGLDITPPAAGTQDGPTITTANLLADTNTRVLLLSGFPTRLHYRLELWRTGGWFNQPGGRSEWDVVVRYDPTTQLYNVVRTQDNNRLETVGAFPTVAGAEAQFGRPFRTTLHPGAPGRYYYNIIVDVQTLTESDLDALQQWLRGPSAPGKSNPLKAVRSAIGRLLSRVLGGDKRHYEARTGVFTVAAIVP